MMLRTLVWPFTRFRSRSLPTSLAGRGRGDSTEATVGAVANVAVDGAVSAGAPAERVVTRLLRELPPLPYVAAGAAAVALLTVLTLVVTRAEVANSPSRLDQEPASASVSTPLMAAAADATAAAASSETTRPAADAAATSSTPAAASPSTEVTTTEALASASSDAPAADVDAPLLVAFWAVQAGESLSTLASEFGTTVEAILAYNALRDANSIYVGQKLAIPVQPGLPITDGGDVVELSPDEPWVVSWTVSDGDSLLALAYRFGTTVDAIVARNGLSDSSAIYASQSLAIAIGPQPRPESTTAADERQ